MRTFEFSCLHFHKHFSCTQPLFNWLAVTWRDKRIRRLVCSHWSTGFIVIWMKVIVSPLHVLLLNITRKYSPTCVHKVWLSTARTECLSLTGNIWFVTFGSYKALSLLFVQHIFSSLITLYFVLKQYFTDFLPSLVWSILHVDMFAALLQLAVLEFRSQSANGSISVGWPVSLYIWLKFLDICCTIGIQSTCAAAGKVIKTGETWKRTIKNEIFNLPNLKRANITMLLMMFVKLLCSTMEREHLLGIVVSLDN